MFITKCIDCNKLTCYGNVLCDFCWKERRVKMMNEGYFAKKSSQVSSVVLKGLQGETLEKIKLDKAMDLSEIRKKIQGS